MIDKILPFEDLKYKSSLSKQELIKHLNSEIEVQPVFSVWPKKTSKPYAGNIVNDQFKIIRVINYRNSFLPEITGVMNDEINGCSIKVKMKLIGGIKVFMIVWLSGALFANIAFICPFVFQSERVSSDIGSLIIPFFMLVFGFILVWAGFKAESKKSLKDLENLLKAKIVSK